MIVLNILGYFGRNKQNSYAALIVERFVAVNQPGLTRPQS